MLDLLREKSLQQLKESDPQAFVLPRLNGRAKVALAELLYDEFGAGRPPHLHQALYAEALTAAGLDPTYGAYVDDVSALTLANANVASLFALNRRLLGAAMGHFATFEATSSVPSRKIAAGIERLGLPSAVSAYFHEHVEADAVHEQVALGDICGTLVSEQPSMRPDVLFGAASCLHLEGLVRTRAAAPLDGADGRRLVSGPASRPGARAGVRGRPSPGPGRRRRPRRGGHRARGHPPRRGRLRAAASPAASPGATAPTRPSRADVPARQWGSTRGCAGGAGPGLGSG